MNAVLDQHIAIVTGGDSGLGAATAAAMNRNLTVKLGNCNHRRYVPQLTEAVLHSGRVDPLPALTQREPMHAVIDAYRAFDTRTPGWIKVELAPGAY